MYGRSWTPIIITCSSFFALENTVLVTASHDVVIRDSVAVPSATAPPNPNESLCEKPDASKVSAATASEFRGVPFFLWNILEYNILPAFGTADHWFDKFVDMFNVSLHDTDCVNVDSDTCQVNDALCYTQAEAFWTISSAANFHNFMTIFNGVFTTATQGDSLLLGQVSDDFPIQAVDLIASQQTLANNLGAALGLAGGAMGVAGEFTDMSGLPLIGGALGVLGGLLGDIGANLKPGDTPTSEKALHIRMNAVFDAVTTRIGGVLDAVFVTGDLTNYTACVPPSDYNISIAAFFDHGNFFYGTSGLNELVLQKTISAKLLQGLVGVALTEANYYILKDAYTPDLCPTDQTGAVIDNSCFTLEVAGYGGKATAQNSRGDYSNQVTNDTLIKVTSKYNITLTDLYRSSYNCQKATQTYHGGSPDMNLTATIEDCFYNIPVFQVSSDISQHPSNASPCFVKNANLTATKGAPPQAGITYLPDNLQLIFGALYFCYESCFLPRCLTPGSRL